MTATPYAGTEKDEEDENLFQRIHPIDRIIPHIHIQVHAARFAQRVARQLPPEFRRIEAIAK